MDEAGQTDTAGRKVAAGAAPPYLLVALVLVGCMVVSQAIPWAKDAFAGNVPPLLAQLHPERRAVAPARAARDPAGDRHPARLACAGPRWQFLTVGDPARMGRGGDAGGRGARPVGDHGAVPTAARVLGERPPGSVARRSRVRGAVPRPGWPPVAARGDARPQRGPVPVAALRVVRGEPARGLVPGRRSSAWRARSRRTRSRASWPASARPGSPRCCSCARPAC